MLFVWAQAAPWGERRTSVAVDRYLEGAET